MIMYNADKENQFLQEIVEEEGTVDNTINNDQEVVYEHYAPRESGLQHAM